MGRIHELLNKTKQFTEEDEVLIYVKDGEMTALYYDGDSLVELSGLVTEGLTEVIERMKASE
jgi:oligoribonuclease (3'-5' exoribonuclease)